MPAFACACGSSNACGVLTLTSHYVQLFYRHNFIHITFDLHLHLQFHLHVYLHSHSQLQLHSQLHLHVYVYLHWHYSYIYIDIIFHLHLQFCLHLHLHLHLHAQTVRLVLSVCFLTIILFAVDCSAKQNVLYTVLGSHGALVSRSSEVDGEFPLLVSTVVLHGRSLCTSYLPVFAINIGNQVDEECSH